MFWYMVSLFHCCDPGVREITMLVRVPVRACQEAERERERTRKGPKCALQRYPPETSRQAPTC